MSDTIRSYGYIAVLTNPPGNDAFEEISERLYGAKSDLGINYAGTLLYSDKNRHAGYVQRTNTYGLSLGAENDAGTPEQFMEEATAAGLIVDPDTVRPYNCIWHNSSDSDMSMLDKNDFLQRTGQA